MSVVEIREERRKSERRKREWVEENLHTAMVACVQAGDALGVVKEKIAEAIRALDCLPKT